MTTSEVILKAGVAMTDGNWKNKLYFGDNLTILQDHITDESVDLIYLDPPFNSKATYNVLFKEKDGADSTAQITAFDDTWHWGIDSERAYEEVVLGGGKLADLLGALRSFLGTNDMMAYLTMMAIRLKELHRALKPTGSLYLHCDPTASHYLKLILDAVFGPDRFKNEIIWKRTSTKSDYRQGATNWPRVHDVLLCYQRNPSTGSTFRQLFSDYSEDYINNFYRHRDPDGRRYSLDNLAAPGAGTRGHPQYEFMGVTRFWRYNKEKMEMLAAEGRVIQTKTGSVPRYKRYLDEMPGVAISDVWTDLGLLQGQSKERLGYPTQKPEALLERIIQASSNEGDIVLDPFCGCGTAIAVAERLHRKWIGIDLTHLAVTLMKHRLNDSFGKDLAPYEVLGDPKHLSGANALALEDRYQFEWWALGLVEAQPAQDKKKGADKGIDGLIYFIDNAKGEVKKVLVQVKSGHVQRALVSDLCHAVEREGAAIGLFVTLEKPTRPMIEEAATAGFYEATELGKKFPKMQILTIEELLDGKQAEYPRGAGRLTYTKAKRTSKQKDKQSSLFDS